MTFALSSPEAPPVTRARALTLYQPWAWLVAHGHKPIENRPRGTIPLDWRGEFWIHAAQESEKSIASWPLAQKLCVEILGNATLIPTASELAFGAIIGRATITGVYPPRLDDIFGNPEPRAPWHFPDKYGFTLTNAVALEKPVPCRGYQGFWAVPDHLLQTLREQGK